MSEGKILRLYTSIGMEAAAYMPSHIEVGAPGSAGSRVGKTTGYGPQVGVGFTAGYENVIFYSYGTVAHGAIIESDDYRYNSMTINAGFRFGNTLNVRYSYGDYAWAPDGNKTAQLSRFTVGIIIDDL